MHPTRWTKTKKFCFGILSENIFVPYLKLMLTILSEFCLDFSSFTIVPAALPSFFMVHWRRQADKWFAARIRLQILQSTKKNNVLYVCYYIFYTILLYALLFPQFVNRLCIQPETERKPLLINTNCQ
jgi:hypothetical protein